MTFKWIRTYLISFVEKNLHKIIPSFFHFFFPTVFSQIEQGKIFGPIFCIHQQNDQMNLMNKNGSRANTVNVRYSDSRRNVKNSVF